MSSEAIVQIRTNEDLDPWEKQLSPFEKARPKGLFPEAVINIYSGVRNFLGAYTLHEDCYYDSPQDNYNFAQQYWTVTKVGGGTDPILFGDAVIITNRYKQANLCADGSNIATGANETWTIDPT